MFAPAQSLLDRAAAAGLDLNDEAFAASMDSSDEFSHLRQQFWIPHRVGNESEESVYLCGNSLGLQPRRAQVYLQEEMTKWAQCGVEGHFRGARPWANIDETVTGLSAQVVGAASSDEVAVMNSLSVNMHIMLTSFYRPTDARHKIIIEDNAFCSDNHIFDSQIRLHGRDPADSLIRVAPRAGEHSLRTEDILAVIAEHGASTAVVCFSGVQFYTGQAFDMRAITAAAHAQGCIAGFDLAHAAGNVELKLHEWDVDFACWCSYKYLNSGPGSIAGCFVHSRHANDERVRMAGWWGQDASVRFQMLPVHQPKAGAQGYQLSNPAVLPTICLLASLEVFALAGGVPKLRQKSVLLTSYLELLLNRQLGPQHVTILTPTDPEQRGCQLSLSFAKPIERVHAMIEAAGVICDIRRPNVMRIAPTPLYNSFADVRRFVNLLQTALNSLDA